MIMFLVLRPGFFVGVGVGVLGTLSAVAKKQREMDKEKTDTEIAETPS